MKNNMKYTIAKLPMTEAKILSSRKSFDSRNYYWEVKEQWTTGCKKLDDFITCIHDLCKSTSTICTEIKYDAASDTLNVCAKRYGTPLYFMNFKITVAVDDAICYSISVDKIDWKKIVKDASVFNKGIRCEGDTLFVNYSNHAELKLVVNAVKRHFNKFNLCEHYREYKNGNGARVETTLCTDEELINVLNKHAKTAISQRVKTYYKKYDIKTKTDVAVDNAWRYHYGPSQQRAMEAEKYSDGMMIVTAAACYGFNDPDWGIRRNGPTFVIKYYVNTKNGKITWKFDDDEAMKNTCIWCSHEFELKIGDYEIDSNFVVIDDKSRYCHNNMTHDFDTWFRGLSFILHMKDAVNKAMKDIDLDKYFK